MDLPSETKGSGPRMTLGASFLRLQERVWWVVSESLRPNIMSMTSLNATRLFWSPKGLHRLKE